MAGKPTSPEKAENIRKLYAGGMSCNAIAKKLHMKWETVREICKGIPDPHQGRAISIFTSMGFRKAMSCRHSLPDDHILSDVDY